MVDATPVPSKPEDTAQGRFRAAGRGPWHGVPPEQWDDWRWQLKNRITTLAELERHLALTPEERAGVILSGSRLAMAITPYFFNLIDPADPTCPIRRQIVPRIEEMSFGPEEMEDPCGEDRSMAAPGLVHRYPDRALFLVTDRCAAYCRYCTRSRVVSGAHGHLDADHEAAIRYIAAHPEIRDVLLSGGDPLLFTDEKLDSLLQRLRAIPHVEFLRIGTRIPIFLPQRITPGLVDILRQHHPLWMSVHVNHPRELTAESRAALARLADAGIPLGNQSVLLRGINDSADVMLELVHGLLLCRVRPYYLYQCDLIRGSAHLRTTVREGIDIINDLRGHTTGYAVPQYVVDGPGGGGKIPLNPEYLLAHDGDSIVLRNFKGDIYEYPEAGRPAPLPSRPSRRHDEIVCLGLD
ncbi:MAG: KamA family radical SAM protein [Verrucomicrobiae bacterium]|nr:KamA family radical SAM protein [Verrucomicrobiae bacterium]